MVHQLVYIITWVPQLVYIITWVYKLVYNNMGAPIFLFFYLQVYWPQGQKRIHGTLKRKQFLITSISEKENLYETFLNLAIKVIQL